MREVLDHKVLLRFLSLVLPQEVLLELRATLATLALLAALVLLHIYALQKALSAFFHLDKAGLQALPELVVLGAPDI